MEWSENSRPSAECSPQERLFNIRTSYASDAYQFFDEKGKASLPSIDSSVSFQRLYPEIYELELLNEYIFVCMCVCGLPSV